MAATDQERLLAVAIRIPGPMVWRCSVLLLLAACGTQGFRTIDGQAIEPMPVAGDAAVVWVFVSPDCPVANASAPEIESIWRDYRGRGVRLLLVHVQPGDTDQVLATHAVSHGLTCPVIADRRHELVQRAGATVTPEAALFDKKGTLRYRGRIDDLYPALGTRKPEAAVHDLRAALDDVLAGRKVAVERTEAVGCAIEALAGR
jgi:AhpC/TSA family